MRHWLLVGLMVAVGVALARPARADDVREWASIPHALSQAQVDDLVASATAILAGHDHAAAGALGCDFDFAQKNGRFAFGYRLEKQGMERIYLLDPQHRTLQKTDRLGFNFDWGYVFSREEVDRMATACRVAAGREVDSPELTPVSLWLINQLINPPFYTATMEPTLWRLSIRNPYSTDFIVVFGRPTPVLVTIPPVPLPAEKETLPRATLTATEPPEPAPAPPSPTPAPPPPRAFEPASNF